jgi:hypothetical protein
MIIPIIFGLPLHLWLGIILIALIVFQIAVAKKILHVPFKWHRVGGYILLLLGIIHGLIGIGLYMGILAL